MLLVDYLLVNNYFAATLLILLIDISSMFFTLPELLPPIQTVSPWITTELREIVYERGCI
jgi:hypothetical protein